MTRKNNGKITVLFLAAVIVVTLLCVLCACNGSLNDNSFKGEDYIEVKSLRIADGSANIYMSSSGDPSTKQLNIVTEPADATNKKLVYYVPSDYHGYLTVSETGLLTAHKVTDGTVVPVTVTSTTNSKATLTVSVVVEDVAVSSVGFSEENLSLVYNGKPAVISAVYKPSHAIDGRNASFSSTNENICTVTADGTVTPVGVGYARVMATCTTRTGKTITNYLEVFVSYATGDYQLEVSGNPSFNQVIGNYTPIDFTLLILGENVDPSPEISWYIGETARVDSNEDRLQYTHIPTATTELSYYIKVVVRPAQGNPVVLKSDIISCHNAFNGIVLNYENLSAVYDGYRYGDEVTFDISSGDASATIVSYAWDLSFASDAKNEVRIATTSLTDRNLTRRINVTGDYSLIAKGLDVNGNLVSQQKFTFSAEKFAVGDTLVISPSPREYGLPPDSYHWYVVRCDESGNYDAKDKTLYADTQNGKKLVMPLNESGAFRLIVTASIGGVPATTLVNGENVAYELVSDVIRVYGDGYEYAYSSSESLLPFSASGDVKRLSDKDYPLVSDVTVEGIGGRNGGNGYQVFVKWNNYGPVPSYVIELTLQSGEVTFIDSANPGSSRFGSNFCYIDKDVVSLNDVFDIRVKQKNGSYSPTLHYGSLNEQGTSDKTHVAAFGETLYPFFSIIGYNNASRSYTVAETKIMDAPAINGYFTDMNDLISYLSFVTAFRPSTNTYVQKSTVIYGSAIYDAFSANLYIPFTYAARYETIYPHGLSEDELTSYGDYADIAKLFFGAASVLPYKAEFRLQFAEREEGVRVSIMFPNGNTSLKNTTTPKGETSQSLRYVSDVSEDVDVSGLPVDLLDEVTVRTSDELVEMLIRGYRPVPGDESLVNLYKILKNVVVRVTNSQMTDEEKAVAFFDYIALNTALDPQIDTLYGTISDSELYRYVAFKVESVFTGNHASTDVGIAKAYAALCRIAGITCVTATAYALGSTHTFNKVYVDGKWYVADVAGGMVTVDGRPAVNYDYLFISDEDFIDLYTEGTDVAHIYGEVPVAATSANYSDKFSVASDETSLKAFFESLSSKRAGTYCTEIRFDKSEFVDAEEIKRYLQTLSFDGAELHLEFYVIPEDNPDEFRSIVIFDLIGE